MVSIPVVQIVGYKNAGKTQLMCRLIERLDAIGCKVGTVKHDAHAFDIDHEGRDTWQHRRAGAHAVAITSPGQTAWIEQSESPLTGLIDRMSSAGIDIVLAEGFKSDDYPKIVLLRSVDEGDLPDKLTHVVAIVTTFEWKHAAIPVYHRDDTEGLLRVVLSLMGEKRL